MDGDIRIRVTGKPYAVLEILSDKGRQWLDDNGVGKIEDGEIRVPWPHVKNAVTFAREDGLLVGIVEA
jgi:hypothetical protein